MAVFSGGSIFTLIWEAFLRRKADATESAHLHRAPSFWFVLPALLLAVVGAVTTLGSAAFQPLLNAAAGSIAYGMDSTLVDKTLKLWYGWTPVFIMSLVVLALAVLIVFGRRFVRGALEAA